MDDLTRYYEKEYHKTGYTMEGAKDYSRVHFFKEALQKYLKPGSRVLDIGCGDGYLSKIMPEFEWVGIDINTHHNPKALKVDISQAPYPFKEKEFDAAVCSEVLEHMWEPRVIHREAYRTLKENGLYVISTPNYDHIDYLVGYYRQLLFDGKSPHLYEHIRQYNYEVHEMLLKECGFKPSYHIGADAQYTRMFSNARRVLKEYFNSQADADIALGQCFPDFSHTIVVVSHKP